MSKLARQIIVTIIAGISLVVINLFLPLCYVVNEGTVEIINKPGFYICTILECLFAIGLIVCTILIWIKKKVPDITIGKRD